MRGYEVTKLEVMAAFTLAIAFSVMTMLWADISAKNEELRILRTTVACGEAQARGGVSWQACDVEKLRQNTAWVCDNVECKAELR